MEKSIYFHSVYKCNLTIGIAYFMPYIVLFNLCLFMVNLFISIDNAL